MEQILIGSRKMAGMQRFVTYIYAYEDGEKSGNTGYAKIEVRGNNGRAEIHFLGSKTISGMAPIAFLYFEDGKWQEIRMSELRLENGRGMRAFTFQTESVQGTGISFEQLAGIKIMDSAKRLFMSFWKNVPALGETEYKEQLLSLQSKKDVKQELEKRRLIEDAEQESLHTMEIPMKNVFPVCTMEEVWRRFEKKRDCMQLNGEVSAVSIELNDLRELPKQYWYLGNNSFLLHGFFNYHHLLLGKLSSGQWFLGVPGVGERQERLMASVFGFPGFLCVAETLEESETESEKMDAHKVQQGVWYHILED